VFINRKLDLVSLSELFARADLDPAATAATATPAAGTHKRQISEVVPQEERPNGPETTPRGAATIGFGGVPKRPRGQIQVQAQTQTQTLAQSTTPTRVAEPANPNDTLE
jgi:hypothetical protein